MDHPIPDLRSATVDAVVDRMPPGIPNGLCRKGRIAEGRDQVRVHVQCRMRRDNHAFCSA
jgi:hypothetical protein